jgi:hypothetical protein
MTSFSMCMNCGCNKEMYQFINAMTAIRHTVTYVQIVASFLRTAIIVITAVAN